MPPLQEKNTKIYWQNTTAASAEEPKESEAKIPLTMKKEDSKEKLEDSKKGSPLSAPKPEVLPLETEVHPMVYFLLPE